MIEKMKAVCVVTKYSDKENLLDSLRDIGVLHIAEKKAADGKSLSRLSSISRLLVELKDYVSKEQKKEPSELSPEQFEELYEKTLSALERRSRLTEATTEIKGELEKLSQWGDFDSKEVKEVSDNLNLHFYQLDKKAYKKLCQNESLEFVRFSTGGQMYAVAVVGELDGSINAVEFVIPERGSVQLKEELCECEKELLACEEILKESAGYLKRYSEELLKTKNDAEYTSVGETLCKDEELIWISGYIPISEEESFVGLAKERGWAFLIDDVDDEDANVPTKIRYNKLTALIKPVFEILGVVPGYKEYDISFWFLAFFSLFFAMIIGDAGYGALFLAFTVVLNAKTKKLTNITLLLYLLSATTIIWGALTGTWFGLESAMKVPFLRALVIPSIANYPEYFSVGTAEVQNNVMKFCFSIGFVQLALACIMNIRRRVTEKNLSFLADLGWLSSISAIYFMVLNLVIGESVSILAVAVAIGVGFLLVVLFGGMSPEKSFKNGLKAGLGGAFTAFLNTISAFGNVMSYIRLFAVGMASLAIAQSFNDMAAGFDGALVVVGAIIMAIGHLLNIVMGFLSVVVHGMRLNLLEFSGQLGMEWSGVGYEPFKKLKK